MGLALAFFALGGLLTLLLVRARSEIETGSLEDERHEAAPPSIRSAEDESPTASIPSTTMPSEPKTAQPKAAQPKTGQPPRAQAPALAAPAPSGPRPSPAPRTTAAAPPVTAPAPVTPPPAVRADCNPPFTIDARGIQRIKPGCLR
jgi:serine/threonine-protein kinase